MCGISLVARNKDAASLCISILQRLQHRGHQGAKIVHGDLANPNQFSSHGGLGKIDNIFSLKDFENIDCQWCIGHTRYTTYSQRSNSRFEDLQPFVIDTLMGTVILAHNGQIGGSAYEISQHRQNLMERGYSFFTESDTELLLGEISLLQNSDTPFEFILTDALERVKGSASIVGAIIDNNGHISWFGARKQGNRPLFMGITKQEGRDGHVFSSEDYMLQEYGVTEVCEISPFSCVFVRYTGEIDIFNIQSQQKEYKTPRYCIFELFYFSYPLTTFKGISISQLRKAFGRALYNAHKDKLKDIDVVMSVPDSGNHAALGFSHASGVPLDYGILRNHFIGRSFIEQSNQRKQRADQKYLIDHQVVKDRHIAVIDDSLVRGTTARVLVKKLREYQPKSISFLVASPPIKHPNYYGIDIRDCAIAANFDSIEELGADIGVDYLGYLDLDVTVKIISEMTGQQFNVKDFCTCCFSGEFWHNNLE